MSCFWVLAVLLGEGGMARKPGGVVLPCPHAVLCLQGKDQAPGCGHSVSTPGSLQGESLVGAPEGPL